MFRRGGSTLHAVRAVDTATHPDHQGRGLFTALTMHALEACRAEGVAFVFNTPNAQSRPGYLKMGWREVGRPPGRACGHAARATSSPSPAAVSRPSAGRCRSTSAPTSRRGSTRAALAGTAAGVVDGPDVADRVRRTVRPLALRPAPICTTASSTIGDAAIVVRLRRRGAGRELVVAEQLGDPDRADRLVVDTLRRVGRDPRPAPRRPEPPPWLRDRAGRRPDPHVAGRVRPRSAAAAQLGPAPRRPRAVLRDVSLRNRRLRSELNERPPAAPSFRRSTGGAGSIAGWGAPAQGPLPPRPRQRSHPHGVPALPAARGPAGLTWIPPADGLRSLTLAHGADTAVPRSSP